jgi:hypothetical protein
VPPARQLCAAARRNTAGAAIMARAAPAAPVSRRRRVGRFADIMIGAIGVPIVGFAMRLERSV